MDNKEWPVLDDVKKLAVQLGSRRMEFRDIEDMWLMGIGGGQATYHVPLVAAPQGSRVAIISAVGDKWTVVADGHAGALYDDIRALGEHSQPVFSPDGQHLAYVAKKAEKWIVVRDEKEGPEFDDIGRDLTFRPDGSSVAYAALDGDQWHAVIAGEKGPGYVDGISRPLLSFDGARSAYFAWQGDKIRAMVDGRTGPEFEAVGGLTFSDDSKHVAYRGRTSKGWHMVLDQNPGPAFESVQGTAVFAPSGDSVAYAASSGGQWHLVVDNEPVTPYAGGDLLSYSLGAFRFNVDGTSHAYNASRQEETGTSWIVKVDSAEPLEYNRAWEPVFSPGGAHVAWVASEGEQEFVVLDGARDPVYAEVLTRSPVFGSDGALEYLAWKDNDLYRVRHSPVY